MAPTITVTSTADTIGWRLNTTGNTGGAKSMSVAAESASLTVAAVAG